MLLTSCQTSRSHTVILSEKSEWKLKEVFYGACLALENEN